jgi:uroporphyrinogen III methyltransferase/synthase
VSSTVAGIADAVRDAGMRNPLLTVVGEVASLREHIGWFENRPLFGKRVLVTRTRTQASALADLLRREGAIPVELPALELSPIATDTELDAMTQRLQSRHYDWCLFTSINATNLVFEYLERSDRDVRVFAGCKLAALGTATAGTLKAHGLRPDLVASEFTSLGLVDSLPLDIGGLHILLPRATGGVDLRGALRARGAIVDEIAMYENTVPASADAEVLELLRDGQIDAATFASSSSVSNLAALLGDDFEHLKGALIASIGPVTSETAREHELEVGIEASPHTIPALVEALKERYARG